MTTFPARPYSNIADYYSDYSARIVQALASVDTRQLERANEILAETIDHDRQIFSCGNGGSAAIANHLVCDHARGICNLTGLRPRVQSLSSNIEIITAIANDASYADVFCHQLDLMARPGDALITISSSGDSENVVRAIAHARANGIATIAMTGFSGGRSATGADVNIHVDADNYGVIEDVHQSLMHVLAQFIRQSHLSPATIAQSRF
ncbi:SIS domain-containing protein [Magnetospirillum gryphiswaldense]|uniref:Phosphoheptose isomerase n=1 Tax=Magnetospirillum gryphiswaldense TaxID=55518 RepID=A4U2U7_9PROT|nr:SIS domain-containing protein [Magnetospirillum gryphiswaldense]AVM75618.1 Phosphoheptose isomerase [Magnetospirillum gryphiswaldense MSR-1]AVM79521.1 Phosphoheptose isomerase [Magnetospirillum gryphiswaldense]CAM77204.1 Phosphoheptose isomerase [Magnetospirillum gryphiswaldense MSR-1]